MAENKIGDWIVKKVIFILILFILCFSMIGCGSSEEKIIDKDLDGFNEFIDNSEN